MSKYDIIIIGSGPGGYVTGIRASQLGFKVAIVEKENLGGICLNWGCIPTKALLKSAQVYDYLKHVDDYGLKAEAIDKDFDAVIKRSRGVAEGMSKGVQFLMKKNKIDVIEGTGKLKRGKVVEVTAKDDSTKDYLAKSIVVATGSRSRELPNLKQDGKNVIGYREAMTLPKMPKSMIIVGTGAIGVEFGYFYHSMGCDVTLVEYLPNIMPREDTDVSRELEKIYKKKGMGIMTNASVENVKAGKSGCEVEIKTAKRTEKKKVEVVLSAVGIQSNIEGIGLEDLGIKTEKGKITVDEFYQTSAPGIYAIGDVIDTPALAHVASAEGITCVEKISGMHVEPIDYTNIPGCTYCSPEVASLGMTEKEAKENGYELKVGKFPFSASGKASAAGAKEGFVKVIYDAKYGELLGAHMIGMNVTEMIAEMVAAKRAA